MAKQPKQAIPEWYVTAAMLHRRGACSSQVRLFLDTFGNRKVEFNEKNWNRAKAAGLSVEWLAIRMLPYNTYCRIYNGRSCTIPERMFNALERQRLNTRITI